MTKRSLKGTILSAFERAFNFSGWNPNLAESAQDNPINAVTLVKEPIDAHMMALIKGLVTLVAPTTDVLILSGGVITVNGSLYSITAGYLYLNGEIIKINASNDTAGGGEVGVLKIHATTVDGSMRVVTMVADTSGSGICDFDEVINFKDFISIVSGGIALGGDVKIFGIGADRSGTLRHVEGIGQEKDYLEFSNEPGDASVKIRPGITWTIKELAINGSFSTTSQTTSLLGLFFKDDGTKMYVSNNSTIYEYALSTAWDVTTATYTDSFAAGTNINSGKFFIGNSGLKLYTVATTDIVYEYDLSVAWDVSTALINQSFNMNSIDQGMYQVVFKSDGLKMYSYGTENDLIYEFDLSVAWDVSTLVYSQSFDPSLAAMQSFFFNDQGTKLFILDFSPTTIYEFDLSVAWDVSTAVLFTSTAVTASSNAARNLFIRSDGLKLYLADDNGDQVDEYDLEYLDAQIETEKAQVKVVKLTDGTYSGFIRIVDGGTDDDSYVKIQGKSSGESVNIHGDGDVQFTSYGSGTLSSDASGNITSSSDRNLKEVIGPVKDVLKKIEEFEPVYHKWTKESGLDTTNVYMSTIAQSIQKSFPEAVGKDSKGNLTVSDRAVIAVLISAIKELKQEVNELKNK